MKSEDTAVKLPEPQKIHDPHWSSIKINPNAITNGNKTPKKKGKQAKRQKKKKKQRQGAKDQWTGANDEGKGKFAFLNKGIFDFYFSTANFSNLDCAKTKRKRKESERERERKKASERETLTHSPPHTHTPTKATKKWHRHCERQATSARRQGRFLMQRRM